MNLERLLRNGPRFPTITRENALDYTSESYRTPYPVFKNMTVADHVVTIVKNHGFTDEDISKKLTKILEVFPLVMSVFHNGRRVWYYVYNSGRRSVVRWAFSHRIRNFDVSVIPDLSMAMDFNGNSMLMDYSVSPELLQLALKNDFVATVSLLCFTNKFDGNSLLHFHTRIGNNLNAPHFLYMVADIIFKTVERRSFIADYIGLPDANVVNYASKTPLHQAIISDNPEAVMFLIGFFGAFWFTKGFVRNSTSDTFEVPYVDIAEDLGSMSCSKVLTFAKKEYEIKKNVDTNFLHADTNCSICAETVETSPVQNNNWYRLDCDHHIHCYCLMKLCASGMKMACPECRHPFNEEMLKRSPPTIIRWANIKTETEENTYQYCKKRMETALRTILHHQRQVLPPAEVEGEVETMQVATTSSAPNEDEDIVSRLASMGTIVISSQQEQEQEEQPTDVIIPSPSHLIPPPSFPPPPTYEQVVVARDGSAPSTSRPTPRASLIRHANHHAARHIGSNTRINGRSVRRRLDFTDYGMSVCSSRTRMMFEEIVNIIRQKNNIRDARLGGRRHNDRSIHSTSYRKLVAAAITVNAGFSVHNNSAESLAIIRGIAEASVSRRPPSYVELFGDPVTNSRASPYLISDGENNFSANSLKFDQGVQLDSKLDYLCVPLEDLSMFERGNLCLILDYIYGILCLGPQTFNPKTFSEELGRLVSDAFINNQGREHVCNSPEMRAYIIESFTDFIFLVINNTFKSNALHCMRKYIELHKEYVESLTETNPVQLEVLTAMEHRWNMLFMEQNNGRGLIRVKKAALVNSAYGVCKTGATSLLDLVVAVCNAIL